MTVFFVIEGKKGHLSCHAHGDDGQIHITAIRKQANANGGVEIGSYSVEIATLEQFVKDAQVNEVLNRKAQTEKLVPPFVPYDSTVEKKR